MKSFFVPTSLTAVFAMVWLFIFAGPHFSMPVLVEIPAGMSLSYWVAFFSGAASLILIFFAMVSLSTDYFKSFIKYESASMLGLFALLYMALLNVLKGLCSDGGLSAISSILLCLAAMAVAILLLFVFIYHVSSQLKQDYADAASRRDAYLNGSENAAESLFEKQSWTHFVLPDIMLSVGAVLFLSAYLFASSRVPMTAVETMFLCFSLLCVVMWSIACIPVRTPDHIVELE